ncbi:phenylacetic acid degradation protein PaaN [Parasphingorhabdus sp.]|uniref:phenylacetic acid degradation protein PaaN n=1 Tax=Parasphingorhabdus sp. TaxID=2709688 RepID=UPI003A8E7620
MTKSLSELVSQHQELIEKAVDAVNTRRNWSPFKDSPSRKFYPEGRPEEGKAAFEARIGQKYEIDQPGITGWTGAEVSPYTGKQLGITYPLSDPDILVDSAKTAMASWGRTTAEERIALCLEMALRIYDRGFEMAHSIMHVAGQSFTQAYSGSGPNALDRGIEALAYAAKAMKDVAPSGTWERRFGADDIVLEKKYRMVPRGIGLVICCASFPTWNAYPAMFASLATGNPVIVKPHPIAILPIAIAVEECRAVLADFGFDPNLVTMAADTPEEPVAQKYIDNPHVQIIDFTGSPRYGGYLEKTVTEKLLYTETAGLNSVVIDSTENLAETAKAIARGTCLFSAQMCTSPQNIHIPKSGIMTADGHASFDDVAAALVSAVDDIANAPAAAAGVMGTVQAQNSVDLVLDLMERLDGHEGAQVIRRASPYVHPDFPDARTLTPLIVTLEAGNEEIYSEEHFGPVLFIIAAEDAEGAVNDATRLARQHGAISSFLYSTDADFVDWAVEEYVRSGMNLTINMHGAMWINFAAAYSDYHVTGLNPAGNACLADLAFVASRFRIVQYRQPASSVASIAA